jgi:hypothetical protein
VACTNIIATPYGLHHLIHKHKTPNKQIITCYKSGPKKHESEGKEKKGAGSQANPTSSFFGRVLDFMRVGGRIQ